MTDIEKKVFEARERFQKKSGAKLRSAAFRGDDVELSVLLAQGANAREKGAEALRSAAMAKSAKCVEMLLPKIGADSSAAHAMENALREAARNGSSEIVAMILAFQDGQVGGSCIRESLVLAASLGHARCVEAMIPFAKHLEALSMALRRAAASGQAECAKLLLPVADHSDNDFEALRYAARRSVGGSECVELLLPLAAAMLPGEEAQNAINDSAGGAAINGRDASLALVIPFANQQGRLAAMILAAKNKEATALSRLIEATGVSSDGFEQAAGEALHWAALLNNESCVSVLAPVANCKADGSLALATAASGGFDGCVLALLPWSDPLATREGELPLDAAGTARAYGQHHTAELIDAYREQAELSAHEKPCASRGSSPRI